MTIKPGKFIRRFLIHVLPNGFHRIRHYGLLASGTKAQTVARARELIAAAKPAQTAQKQRAPDSAAATDQPPHPCPCCGGRMIIIETFERGSTPRYPHISSAKARSSPAHRFAPSLFFIKNKLRIPPAATRLPRCPGAEPETPQAARTASHEAWGLAPREGRVAGAMMAAIVMAGAAQDVRGGDLSPRMTH